MSNRSNKNLVLVVLALCLFVAASGAQTSERRFQTLSNASRATVGTAIVRNGEYQFQFDQAQLQVTGAELKLWVVKGGDGTIDASSRKLREWVKASFDQRDFKNIVETEARRRLNELFPNKMPPAMESRVIITITISTKPPEYSISIEW